MVTAIGALRRSYYNDSEAERIFNAFCTKEFYRHAIHRPGVDAVMPNETAEHFAERPSFVIAALDDCILKKVRRCFQCFKSAFTALVNASVVVGIHMDLRKIILVYVLCVHIHFLSRAGNDAVKGFACGCCRCIFIGNRMIQGKKVLCRPQRKRLQFRIFFCCQRGFFAFKEYV